MARPRTRYARQQNAAFLRHLRRTGNVRDAARASGVNRATLHKRRAAHPDFAAEWDAALALANADLKLGPPARGRAGAEPRVVELPDGRVQLRRAAAGKLDRDAQQRFLYALAASANIRLAAAAAGFSHSAFYRLRERNPAFAREMRLALRAGYERVEMALHASWLEESCADETWRENAPATMPPMTGAQALQLLYLHQKEARLLAEPAHLKKRRGESNDAYSYRLAVMYEAGQERAREEYRLAEAMRQLGPRSFADPPAPVIPDLAQLSGETGEDGFEPSRALFGGWRIEMEGGKKVRKRR